jgi:hypothetical protein
VRWEIVCVCLLGGFREVLVCLFNSSIDIDIDIDRLHKIDKSMDVSIVNNAHFKTKNLSNFVILYGKILHACKIHQ